MITRTDTAALTGPPVTAPAPRGGPPPGSSFGEMLTQRQARTATAEGHEKPGRTPSRPAGERTADLDAEAPGTRAAEAPSARATDGGEATAGSGVPAIDGAGREAATTDGPSLEPIPAPAPPVPLPEVPLGGPRPMVTPAAVAATPSADPAAAGGEGTIPPAGLPAAVLAAMAPAAAVASDGAAAAASSATVPTVVGVAAQPASAETTPRPNEIPGAMPASPAGEKGAGAGSPPAVDRPRADTPVREATAEAAPSPASDPVGAPAAEAARTPARAVERPAETAPHAAAAPSGSVPAGSPPPVSAPAPAASAAPPPAAPGVRLSHTAEAVENVIRIASSRGVTHARMALAPAELGGIEIRLRSTAAGLSAEVVAESPDAAQVLQVAVPELRRSLEAQGLNLLSLDIALADRERDTAAGFGDGSARGGRPGGSSSGGGAETDAEPLPDQAIELPDGVLVDVLA